MATTGRVWIAAGDAATSFSTMGTYRRNCAYRLTSGPPFIKDGNAVRYRKSELLAWLDANSRETRRGISSRSEQGFRKARCPA